MGVKSVKKGDKPGNDAIQIQSGDLGTFLLLIIVIMVLISFKFPIFWYMTVLFAPILVGEVISMGYIGRLSQYFSWYTKIHRIGEILTMDENTLSCISCNFPHQIGSDCESCGRENDCIICYQPIISDFVVFGCCDSVMHSNHIRQLATHCPYCKKKDISLR